MRVKLGIGADGEVVLPQRDAEALGLVAGDEVRLQTARGAFAVVARADGATRAYIAGSLSALSAPEALNDVFTSLKSGVMLLAFGAEEERKTAAARPEALRRKSIYFRDGQVVFASSSDTCDRLGAVLFRHGILERKDLNRCGQMVAAGHPLGQILVEEGLLTAGQLYECMTLQVREIVLAACLEREGEFTFLEGPFEERNAIRLPERGRELLLEGMRRADALEAVETELVPSREAVLRPVLPASGGLSLGEARLLEAVDGLRTVREVIDGSELGLHHAMQAIAALLRRGLLQSTSARAAAPPAEEEVFRVTAAVSAPAEPSGPFETYRRIFRYIARELAAVRPDARSRLNSFFDRLPESRRVCFEGVRVDADGDFDVARVLANVEGGAGYPGAAARARALEALESFLAFSLFEVKNCLPRKEAELLLQEVGRMQMGRP